jgi:DNA-binding MarR family transcriptional regulator
MLVLWENDHQSVSEIGERLFLDSGTLTPLLKRLEAASYVQRSRDTHDERRVLVNLTTTGKNLKRKILPLPNKMLQATQCSRSNAMQLAQALNDLRDNLKDSLA